MMVGREGSFWWGRGARPQAEPRLDIQAFQLSYFIKHSIEFHRLLIVFLLYILDYSIIVCYSYYSVCY